LTRFQLTLLWGAKHKPNERLRRKSFCFGIVTNHVEQAMTKTEDAKMTSFYYHRLMAKDTNNRLQIKLHVLDFDKMLHFYVRQAGNQS
jgi:hypothetical protein